MKMIMILLTAAAIFLLGCNEFNLDKVRPLIPGTYYASWKTSFSIAIDSMQITHVSEKDSQGYLIIRRTHLQFINAAKKRAPQYSITKWIGSYNAGDKTISVQSSGRVLSFDPENKMVRMGAIVYRKL